MEELGETLILPGNGIFGALYVLVRTQEEATKAWNKLLEKHGIVTVAGNHFYGTSVNALRLSLVSIPWSEGDELWIQGVRTLKKALM